MILETWAKTGNKRDLGWEIHKIKLMIVMASIFWTLVLSWIRIATQFDLRMIMVVTTMITITMSKTVAGATKHGLLPAVRRAAGHDDGSRDAEDVRQTAGCALHTHWHRRRQSYRHHDAGASQGQVGGTLQVIHREGGAEGHRSQLQGDIW